METIVLLHSYLVQSLEELASHDDFNTLHRVLRLNFLLLDQVCEEFRKRHFLSSQIMNESIDESDGLEIQIGVVQVLLTHAISGYSLIADAKQTHHFMNMIVEVAFVENLNSKHTFDLLLLRSGDLSDQTLNFELEILLWNQFFLNSFFAPTFLPVIWIFQQFGSSVVPAYDHVSEDIPTRPSQLWEICLNAT